MVDKVVPQVAFMLNMVKKIKKMLIWIFQIQNNLLLILVLGQVLDIKEMRLLQCLPLRATRQDGFAENQRNLHNLCVSNFQNFDNRFQSMDTRFQTLDEQIEAIQNQIFELQYGKED